MSSFMRTISHKTPCTWVLLTILNLEYYANRNSFNSQFKPKQQFRRLTFLLASRLFNIMWISTEWIISLIKCAVKGNDITTNKTKIFFLFIPWLFFVILQTVHSKQKSVFRCLSAIILAMYRIVLCSGNYRFMSTDITGQLT